jgi:hypothetical protein
MFAKLKTAAAAAVHQVGQHVEKVAHVDLDNNGQIGDGSFAGPVTQPHAPQPPLRFGAEATTVDLVVRAHHGGFVWPGGFAGGFRKTHPCVGI